MLKKFWLGKKHDPVRVFLIGVLLMSVQVDANAAQCLFNSQFPDAVAFIEEPSTPIPTIYPTQTATYLIQPTPSALLSVDCTVTHPKMDPSPTITVVFNSYEYMTLTGPKGGETLKLIDSSGENLIHIEGCTNSRTGYLSLTNTSTIPLVITCKNVARKVSI